LIFFICPYPEGCEENQFAPFRACPELVEGVWGKQIDFIINRLSLPRLNYKFKILLVYSMIEIYILMLIFFCLISENIFSLYDNQL